MGLSSPRILLAGATGLVGDLVLKHLLADASFRGTVLAPVRRTLAVQDPRLIAPVLDFSQGDEAFAQALGLAAPGLIDSFICCLGTTMRAAGSREAFIAVDRELVLRFSRIARAHGANHALLVSSVGASRQSGNFYLRVKGEVEDALEQSGYARLDLLRPGLLIGPRSERRPAEALFQKLAPLGNVLMQGRFKPYRSIPADTLARGIVGLLQQDALGVHAHGYEQILAAAGAAPG
jgi:uncharacterized protein YbjT (DUF2867 family)